MEAPAVTLPSHRRFKLQNLLADWPSSRTSASVRGRCRSSLASLHMSPLLCVRGGFYVNRLLASVGMPRISAGANCCFRTANPERRLILGPKFQGDLEFRRWFDEQGLNAHGGTLSAPTYHLLERPSQRTVFFYVASKNAPGGFCLETGVYWRYNLDAWEPSHFCGSSKSVAGESDILINVLELLGMVVSAWVLEFPCAEHPAALGDCVLLRGDDEAALEWLRRC